jgi:hypothetical protein
MKEMKFKTREEWLQAGVAAMTPMFKGVGYDVPAIQVSTGWPSKGGVGKKRRTLGQCWSKKASEDGKCQIFISPMLEMGDDPMENVMHVLVHEVVHATVGVDQKHGKLFVKCARAVGLEGPATSTHASPDLMVRIKTWVEQLGPYPHAKLNPLLSGVKKQTTRMIKCECGCGYIARTSKKNILEIGAPICPNKKCNLKPMSFEIPDDEGDEDEGED